MRLMYGLSAKINPKIETVPYKPVRLMVWKIQYGNPNIGSVWDIGSLCEDSCQRFAASSWILVQRKATQLPKKQTQGR